MLSKALGVFRQSTGYRDRTGPSTWSAFRPQASQSQPKSRKRSLSCEIIEVPAKLPRLRSPSVEIHKAEIIDLLSSDDEDENMKDTLHGEDQSTTDDEESSDEDDETSEDDSAASDTDPYSVEEAEERQRSPSINAIISSKPPGAWPHEPKSPSQEWKYEPKSLSHEWKHEVYDQIKTTGEDAQDNNIELKVEDDRIIMLVNSMEDRVVVLDDSNTATPKAELEVQTTNIGQVAPAPPSDEGYGSFSLTENKSDSDVEELYQRLCSAQEAAATKSEDEDEDDCNYLFGRPRVKNEQAVVAVPVQKQETPAVSQVRPPPKDNINIVTLEQNKERCERNDVERSRMLRERRLAEAKEEYEMNLFGSPEPPLPPEETTEASSSRSNARRIADASSRAAKTTRPPATLVCDLANNRIGRVSLVSQEPAPILPPSKMSLREPEETLSNHFPRLNESRAPSGLHKNVPQVEESTDRNWQDEEAVARLERQTQAFERHKKRNSLRITENIHVETDRPKSRPTSQYATAGQRAIAQLAELKSGAASLPKPLTVPVAEKPPQGRVLTTVNDAGCFPALSTDFLEDQEKDSTQHRLDDRSVPATIEDIPLRKVDKWRKDNPLIDQHETAKDKCRAIEAVLSAFVATARLLSLLDQTDKEKLLQSARVEVPKIQAFASDLLTDTNVDLGRKGKIQDFRDNMVRRQKICLNSLGESHLYRALSGRYPSDTMGRVVDTSMLKALQEQLQEAELLRDKLGRQRTECSKQKHNRRPKTNSKRPNHVRGNVKSNIRLSGQDAIAEAEARLDRFDAQRRKVHFVDVEDLEVDEESTPGQGRLRASREDSEAVSEEDEGEEQAPRTIYQGRAVPISSHGSNQVFENAEEERPRQRPTTGGKTLSALSRSKIEEQTHEAESRAKEEDQQEPEAQTQSDLENDTEDPGPMVWKYSVNRVIYEAEPGNDEEDGEILFDNLTSRAKANRLVEKRMKKEIEHSAGNRRGLDLRSSWDEDGMLSQALTLMSGRIVEITVSREQMRTPGPLPRQDLIARFGFRIYERITQISPLSDDVFEKTEEETTTENCLADTFLNGDEANTVASNRLLDHFTARVTRKRDRHVLGPVAEEYTTYCHQLKNRSILFDREERFPVSDPDTDGPREIIRVWAEKTQLVGARNC